MLERMEDCGHALTQADIDRVERETATKLPRSYTTFLLRHNGGLPAPDAFPIVGMDKNPYGIIQEFFGVDCTITSSNLKWNYDTLKGRLPDNLFPIACTPSGDILCLVLELADEASVVLWDFYAEHHPPTNANVYQVAGSFEKFLGGLFRAPESQR
jgi:hypothetical protein